MRVFHGTTRAAARLIDRDGFRHGAPHYLGLDQDSDEPVDLVGVWVSDGPLDENEGAGSEVYYVVDLPAERFTEFELVQDIGYREACVPAAVLNACPRERFDELPDEPCRTWVWRDVERVPAYAKPYRREAVVPGASYIAIHFQPDIHRVKMRAGLRHRASVRRDVVTRSVTGCRTMPTM